MCLNVGERVRSFDFDSRELKGESACYIEGIIEKVNGVYKIKVERQVFAGEEISGAGSLVGKYVFPPINGSRKLFGGEFNAVVKIEEV